MYTSQHKMAKSPLKYCPVLSQSEHNRLDNNSTNFTVQTCTKLSLPLISGCRQRKWPSFESLSSYTRLSELTCPVRSEAQTVSIWRIITRVILLRGHCEITIRLRIFFWVWVSLQSFFAGLLFLFFSPLVSQTCQVTCSCLTTCKIRCTL